MGDTTAVGSYPAGASSYGVMDMAGNVFEWISDWYNSAYYSSQSNWTNPLGPLTGGYKVLRGGSWLYGTVLRVAARSASEPSYHYGFIGFRCAAPPGN